MDQKDLQAFGNLLDKKLEEKLESKLEEKLQPIKKDLSEIKETVETHSGTLMRLERDIKVYKEGLQLQTERVDKHEKRLTTVDKNLNLTNKF